MWQKVMAYVTLVVISMVAVWYVDLKVHLKSAVDQPSSPVASP